jgi:hypothetical protein
MMICDRKSKPVGNFDIVCDVHHRTANKFGRTMQRKK